MNSIGIGLIGTKFMGKVHSRAYRDVIGLFNVEPLPELRVICGRDDHGTQVAAERCPVVTNHVFLYQITPSARAAMPHDRTTQTKLKAASARE